MKIYVVTKGEYSDYHIVTVTTDRERAEKIAKRYSDRWDECNIEEYEDCEETTKPVWCVTFDGDTSAIKSIEEETSTYGFYRANIVKVKRALDRNIYVWVFSDDADDAIKIASEKRAEYLAQKEGIV